MCRCAGLLQPKVPLPEFLGGSWYVTHRHSSGSGAPQHGTQVNKWPTPSRHKLALSHSDCRIQDPGKPHRYFSRKAAERLCRNASRWMSSSARLPGWHSRCYEQIIRESVSSL